MLKRRARTPWALLPALLITALLATGLTGCSDDETAIVDPPCEDPDLLHFPATEDQLMANFRVANEGRDVEAYMALLDPGFLMYLQPQTQQEFPQVGSTLDYAEEQIIAERMFSGEAITNSSGDLVPGVSAISFEIFEQQGAWATAGPADLMPGVRFAMFEVTFLWGRQGNSTLRVDGMLKMYVAEYDSVICGTDVTYYRLAGMQDLTNGGGKAGGESASYGSVKALFR